MLGATLALMSCGNPDPDPPDDDDNFTVEVTVNHAGGKSGDLRITGFTTNTDTCPPPELPKLLVSLEDVTFPVVHTFTKVDAGTYYVKALLDVDGDLPLTDCPLESDDCGEAESPVTVSADNPAATISLDVDTACELP